MSSKIERRKFMILAGSSVATAGAFAQEAVPPEAPQGGDADVPQDHVPFQFQRRDLLL